MNKRPPAKIRALPHSLRLTFRRPPRTTARPEYANDYTGKRRGNMTAIYWFRPSQSGNATVWVCRCDCGLYEYRRPGTWDSKPFPDDKCGVCQRAEEQLRGPNARETAPERLQQWTDGLRSLGLEDAEIAELQQPGVQVDTKGRSAQQIREQLARARE